MERFVLVVFFKLAVRFPRTSKFPRDVCLSSSKMNVTASCRDLIWVSSDGAVRKWNRDRSWNNEQRIKCLIYSQVSNIVLQYQIQYRYRYCKTKSNLEMRPTPCSCYCSIATSSYNRYFNIENMPTATNKCQMPSMHVRARVGMAIYIWIYIGWTAGHKQKEKRN